LSAQQVLLEGYDGYPAVRVVRKERGGDALHLAAWSLELNEALDGL